MVTADVRGFLWKQNGLNIVHIHMVGVSTWRYIVLVEKTAQPTPKQKPKHSPNPKRKANLKQMWCAVNQNTHTQSAEQNCKKIITVKSTKITKTV